MRPETYTQLVFSILLFTVVGIGFIFVHLVAGKFLRPVKPDDEKLTIYECGEPTIGSAWIQFDLRFYVVALLFVIFDVEVAFFFPWAVVFGSAVALAMPDKVALSKEDLTNPEDLDPAKRSAVSRRLRLTDTLVTPGSQSLIPRDRELPMYAVSAASARSLAWIAFWDILVFFGVLLVGFAYLWRRGDLDWVRSIAAEQPGLAAAPRNM